MLPSRPWDDDDGSASLEFLTAGVLLLVPLVYLVVALGEVQNAALAAEAAARFVARALTTHTDPDLVLRTVAADYGIDPGSLDMRVACTPAAAACPSAGSTVVVTVGHLVDLPLVPEAFGIGDALSVPVDATATAKVSRLWEAP
ncbi:hypothetical protein [Microbacterium indicum]|uniref:hypothetical protein n=1 Tax=Microbacterium indicum TaxID=358100 RepID=UPI0004195050|nr:hypothetical protein [Microbacterium indicum]